MPRIWPVQCPATGISSGFGDHRSRHAHQGIDIPAPKGTPVVATADGVVVAAEHQSGYGRIVKIAHGGGIETWYAHLRSWLVDAGDSVRCGQCIGACGDSGNATGPHLHYEVHVNDVPVNPLAYLPR